MSHYTVVGTAYVRRYQDGDEWDSEEISCQASTDCLYNDTNDDVHMAYDGWADLPKEEGMYVIQFVFNVSFHTDYWGEVDADYDTVWESIQHLTRLQELEVLDYEGLLSPDEKVEIDVLRTETKMNRIFG